MTSVVASEFDSFIIPNEYSLNPFPQRFLGLDINTNHTGFTLLDENGKCIECGQFNTENLSNVFEKAWFVGKSLRELKERTDKEFKDKPQQPRWIIAVEDFLRGFFGAAWQTQHLFVLAQMNSLICNESYLMFDMLPERIHVHRARALFGLKTDKKKVKETVQAYVANKLSEFEWKVRSSGNLVKWSYDVADSYLIAAFMFETFSQAKQSGADVAKMPESAWKKRRAKKMSAIGKMGVKSRKAAAEAKNEDDLKIETTENDGATESKQPSKRKSTRKSSLKAEEIIAQLVEGPPSLLKPKTKSTKKKTTPTEEQLD